MPILRLFCIQDFATSNTWEENIQAPSSGFGCGLKDPLLFTCFSHILIVSLNQCCWVVITNMDRSLAVIRLVLKVRNCDVKTSKEMILLHNHGSQKCQKITVFIKLLVVWGFWNNWNQQSSNSDMIIKLELAVIYKMRYPHNTTQVSSVNCCASN